jgi:hypothetical protein
MPLAAALGRRLKVTTYSKALRQGITRIQHCPQLRWALYSGNDPICGPYLPLKTALNHLFIMFSGLVAKLIVVCRRQFQMFALKTKSSITLHPFTFLWSFRLTPLKCKVNWYPWDHLLQRGS